jgi:hypothetical protein
MEVIEIYEAFDGKRFDDEDEGREYEIRRQREDIGDNFKCFNSDLKPIPLSTILTEGLDRAFYIKISGTSKERYKVYDIFEEKARWNEDNLNGLEEAETYNFREGIFYFDNIESKWLNLEEEHRKQMEFYNSVKKAVEAN